MKSVKTAAVLAALALFLLCGTVAFAEAAECSFSYMGEERSYLECAPEGEVRGIILMLHGYGSDAKSFRLSTGIDVPANLRGYSVVYVDGVPNPDDPTSATGWNSGIGDSTVDDVGFLKALAGNLQEKYGLTRNETFAAGFSNGAFMTYRLALEAGDCFSAVASVAGMMPASVWDSRGEAPDISLLQIYGTKDDAVPKNADGSARFTKAPAIEDVLDYFISAQGLTETGTEEISARATLTKSSGEAKSNRIWQVLIKDGRHSWPEEKYCGFNPAEVILDFFSDVLSLNGDGI